MDSFESPLQILEQPLQISITVLINLINPNFLLQYCLLCVAYVPIKDPASLIAAYRTGLKSYHPYCLLGLYMESGLFDDGDLQKIKATFAKIVNVKLRTIPLSLNCEPRYIKRKPSSGAKERFMRMVEMPIVPFDLPSSNIRGPKASGMKPVPVIQSPSRPVKLNNIQDWKIPPSISKWKNSRGKPNV